MQFDEDGQEELDFWADEPTRPLRRIAPDAPQRGSRSHTGAVPVVAVRESKDGWLPSRARLTDGRLDPFWARLAMLFGAIALLVPVALIVRATGDAASAAKVEPVPSSTVADTSATSAAKASSTAAPTQAPSATAAEVLVAAEPASTAAADTAPPDTAPPSSAARSVASTARRASSKSAGAAAVPTLPATVTCANSYKVVPGDYWLGIAQKTGAKIKDLLATNHATALTVLYPGRTICLPDGASSPVKPVSTAARPAPDTTAAPVTAAPTTAAPTTAAPTTAAPTTAAPKPAPTTSTPAGTVPPSSYTRDQVIQIIRDVWPDDQEDKAIAIATRESNLQPNVRNYCCFGLFQIYYAVHQSWLNAMGITSAEMLYDPRNNAKAALALYYRSGGWGPWGG